MTLMYGYFFFAKVEKKELIVKQNTIKFRISVIHLL